ncbi:MAG: hypothetical protein ABI700_07755 [Chloroflexota bacterium]
MVLFASLGISSAQAATYYYRFFSPPTPTVSCTSSGQPVYFDITGPIGFEWHLPASDATIHDAYLYDGIRDDLAPFMEDGDWQGSFGGYNAHTDNGYPASFGQEYQTEIDGHIVYTSTFLATCTGDGVGTAQIIDPFNSSAGGGGSAIGDGRINPENYAPVALYCDGSVLTAYKIDSTGGTLAWSFDLKSDSSDNPLIDQDGSALSKTGDGRFSVLAGQSDGKQYLFVFDGCPSPGVTEVYESDPVTGQFVRAD